MGKITSRAAFGKGNITFNHGMRTRIKKGKKEAACSLGAKVFLIETDTSLTKERLRRT